MSIGKRHWFWNVLLLLTLVVCFLALLAHYKNWIWEKEDSFNVLSGIYHRELPFKSINEVKWVDKIPSLDRSNGFSAWTKEKGIFVDSLSSNNSIYVYVDNLKQRKLRVRYQDSLLLFINLSDSVETEELYNYLSTRITSPDTKD